MIRSLPPRVVLTYGRFDGFHQGHAQFLRKLAMQGDELIVGCATDAFAHSQSQPCAFPYIERRAVLESCRYVSRVISEASLMQKRTDIVNYNVSVIAVSDQEVGQWDHLRDVAQVIYLPRLIAQSVSTPPARFATKAAVGHSF